MLASQVLTNKEKTALGYMRRIFTYSIYQGSQSCLGQLHVAASNLQHADAIKDDMFEQLMKKSGFSSTAGFKLERDTEFGKLGVLDFYNC